MKLKLNISCFIIFSLLVGITYVQASPCGSDVCDDIKVPLGVKKVIDSGYEDVSINNYLGHNYLTATTKNEINKCSVLFEVSNRLISTTPTIGVNEQICNVSIQDNKVVSSWRDGGQWNDDVYQVNKNGKWVLIFRDSCVGCNQVKRVFYNEGKPSSESLLTDGDDFTSRKELVGEVSVKKASLFKAADSGMKSKAYLVKGDIVTFSDMSIDGNFYRIKYKTKSGGYLISWIKSEDFEFK